MMLEEIEKIQEKLEKLEKRIEDSSMDESKKRAALEYLREAFSQLFMLETTLED